MGIPVQPQSSETATFRGGTWLLFRAVSRQSRSSESLRNSKRWLLCDLALDAVIESSVSLTRSSLTLPRHTRPQTPTRHSTPGRNHTPQSAYSALIAGLSIITSWEFSCRYRSLALPDETPLKIANDAIMQDLMGKSFLRYPQRQEFIVVEENKAYRVFTEWQNRIKGKSAWQTPLGLSLALSLTFATTTFKDFSWISGGTLRGFFLSCMIGSFVWLIYESIIAICSPSASAEQFIADLKKDTERREIPCAEPHEQT
jgi:hypothetical protein